MQHQNTYIVLKKITFLLTNYTDIDLYLTVWPSDIHPGMYVNLPSYNIDGNYTYYNAVHIQT